MPISPYTDIESFSALALLTESLSASYKLGTISTADDQTDLTLIAVRPCYQSLSFVCPVKHIYFRRHTVWRPVTVLG
jgi:hypothetical protein